MKISCPACSAKYSIADDKVQERLAKIRCRKCGATIVIDGKVSPPSVYTAAGEAGDAPAPASSAGPEYSVDFGEGDQRNMSVRDIVGAYGTGQITGETYVWAEGFADWMQLSDVPELMAAVGGAQASSAPAPSPWDARPTATRTSQLPRTGGARANTGRPAADLFGGVSRAGNEDEVATSAPEQPSSAGSSTGTRNESSVLFSLSALTSAAQNQRPSARPPAGAANRDDSGLIDLKALTAAAVKSDTGAMAMPAVPAVAPLASPLGVAAPLGLGSPLGSGMATSSDLSAYSEKKSKTPIIIAGLLSVGMIAVAAAILLRPPPPPPPAPVVVAAPPPTAAPAPTPEPVAATPPATGTAEPAPAPETTTKGKAAPARRPAARRPSGATPTPAPAKKSDDAKPAAAPAKKSDNCGCGPADLQCAMRCAAKKR